MSVQERWTSHIREYICVEAQRSLTRVYEQRADPSEQFKQRVVRA